MGIAVVSGVLALAFLCATVFFAHRFALADGMGDGEPRVLRRLGSGISASIAAAVFFAFISVTFTPIPV